MRQPALFIPHGGGPCFFMAWNPPDLWTALADYLRGIVATLPERPRAILLVSAHWEQRAFTVGTAARPELIFDYYGFPPDTYRLTYPAPGEPGLARRVEALLAGAGLGVAEDARRGFDHGVFVPMKLVLPEGDVPIATLSLRSDHDAQAHLAAGRALAPLRDEGVLILGSGMSFHNLRVLRDPGFVPTAMRAAAAFDAWLTEAIADADPSARLAGWAQAPGATIAHPPGGDEHLLPLFVAAGAGDGPGTRDFHDARLGISAFRFG